MTISNSAATGVTTATGSRGTTSTTVAYVGVAAGRLAVITAGVKPSGATFSASLTDGSGKTWDKVVDGTGGTGTNAADTGQTRIAKYVRILDGSESGSVTISPGGSPGTTTAVMDTYASTVAGWATPWGATGSDASHGTNPTVATAALLRSLAAGDWVHAGYSTDTDSTTATTGQAISQTSTTFGTVTARSRLGNQDGNDGSVFTWDAPVSSGGAATAVTVSLTWAASSCGPLCALALREVTPLTPTRTTVDDFTDNSISASWDAWGGAQITESSARLNLATTTTAGGYYGIARLGAPDLNGSFAGTRVVSMGNQALASFNAYPIAISWSTGNQVYWVVNGNVARCYSEVGGVQTLRAAVPYLPNMHQWFALGISGGNIVAAWSHNGTSLMTEASFANTYGSTTPQPYIMVGTDAVEGSTTTLQVDDYSTWGTAATNATAAEATATGTAYGATVDIGADAATATAAGSAFDVTVTTAGSTNANATEAGGTGQAFDATAATGVGATTATAVGAAFDGAVAIGPAAATATGAGQALDAAVSVGVNAATATAAGAAFDATVSTATATDAQPDTAAATGSAFDTSVAVGATATTASATATAHNAGVAVDAPAGTASATGSAFDAQAAAGAAAGTAAATGAAYDATVSFAVIAPADTATAVGQAFDAAVALAANATAAVGVSNAYDATVSTSSAANAPADAATGSGAAFDVSVAISVLASTATATGAAYSPAIGLGILAGVAVGAGQAFTPSATTSSSATVNAGTATAIGQAFDPPIAISVAAGTATATGVAFDPVFVEPSAPGPPIRTSSRTPTLATTSRVSPYATTNQSRALRTSTREG